MKQKVMLGFKRLTDDAMLPTRAHQTDSGFDLYVSEDIIVEPSETKVIKTGIAVSLPGGYEAQVRPRSGVTSKTKLRVQLGTIDNSYTGEVGIIVDNTKKSIPKLTDLAYTISGEESQELLDELVVNGTYVIRKGDKLAQLVIAPIPIVEVYEVEELKETDRGANGFGSSGYK